MRPHHVLRGVAEERPLFSVVVGELNLLHLERVVDLRCQQIAVLEANGGWGAGEMDVGPAVIGGAAKCAGEARIRPRFLLTPAFRLAKKCTGKQGGYEQDR